MQETNYCRDEQPVNKADFTKRLPELIDEIVESCINKDTFAHIDIAMIPSRKSVIDIIDLLKDILFPGYFGNQELYGSNLKYHIGEEVNMLFNLLSEQITRSVKHDCLRYERKCTNCSEEGYEKTLEFITLIPKLRETLGDDVLAAYKGDPAANSPDEIIFSYPGLYAILVYRIAHELQKLEIPLIPRIMTEHAHNLTGIDIHPAAVIGESLCIDHGTGIVIGETTVIGDRVKIYQGVTLGALSVVGDKKTKIKRHPTIEDDVVLYSNSTILGGDTIIGEKSIIGGNVWLTESVPPKTIVTLKNLEFHKYQRKVLL